MDLANRYNPARMKVDAAIIGGTGVGESLDKLGGKALHVPTSHGLLKGRLLPVEGLNVLLVARHSLGHKTPPHAVNYLAMAEGLRRLGARFCLGTAAVGGLRPDLPPGSFCVCSDFIDLSGRNLTLFESNVEHTDFSNPMGLAAHAALLSACSRAGIKVPARTVYVCTNGPRYETPFEVASFARIGGDVVGMTAASEATAMREAGIDYACLAIVTNPAAGISPAALSHEEVVLRMRESGEATVTILLDAVRRLK